MHKQEKTLESGYTVMVICASKRETERKKKMTKLDDCGPPPTICVAHRLTNKNETSQLKNENSGEKKKRPRTINSGYRANTHSPSQTCVSPLSVFVCLFVFIIIVAIAFSTHVRCSFSFNCWSLVQCSGLFFPFALYRVDSERSVAHMYKRRAKKNVSEKILK